MRLTPFVAAGKASNLSAASTPPEMGVETRMTNRAYRAEKLLEKNAISRQEYETAVAVERAAEAAVEAAKAAAQRAEIDLKSRSENGKTIGFGGLSPETGTRTEGAAE